MIWTSVRPEIFLTWVRALALVVEAAILGSLAWAFVFLVFGVF